MQHQVTIPEQVIPETIKTKKVTRFIFTPDDRNICINVYDSVNSVNYSSNINFATVATELSENNKTFLKAFFKGLAAYALDASVGNISGDILD